MNKAVKIGVLGLTLKLYDSTAPGLKEGREAFIKKALESFEDEVAFDFPGPCNTKEAVDDAVRRFEYTGIDAILVVLLTYAPSLIVLPALKRTSLPIVIWNTQEETGVDSEADNTLFQRNHGVHGVQDLCSVLKRFGINYKVVSGHWQDQTACKKLKDIFKASGAISALYNSKIGLIGYPMQDMGDFNVDETMLLGSLGTSVIHIPVDEYADSLESANVNSLIKIIDNYKKMFAFDSDITDEELRASALMEFGIRQLINKYSLDGWSQHFGVLGSSKRLPSMPFLAASKLMGEGISYSAEGDVTGAVSGIILNNMGGNSTLTEMFTMDFDNNCMMMRHMGELNISMARRDRPVRIIRKVFNLADKLNPPTPVFSLEPGNTTLISLTTGANGKFKLTAAEGGVIDAPEMNNIGTPYFRWRPNGRIEDFLDRYNGAGASHHQAMTYGHVSDIIETFAYYKGLEFIKL